MQLDFTPLDHAWIAARIPHGGDMCLLDHVETWDEHHVICIANNHQDPHHPLRAEGRLGSINGVEYAAQTMAVHGALLTGKDGNSKPRAGFLAIVRDVNWHVDELDSQVGSLSIQATRITGDDTTILYTFDIHAAGTLLMSGRAAVMLDTSDMVSGLSKS